MKAILILVIVILFTLPLFSQAKSPVSIDEFGSVSCEDYLSRMDSAIIQAANNPDAQIYVLVYEGKVSRYVKDRRGKWRIRVSNPEVGLAKAKIRSMRKYLDVRGYGERNFVFVSGGYRENFTVEMWLVPEGAEQPIPKPALTRMKYRKGKPDGFCLGCCP
jgi:hypothetical protein